MPNRKQTRKNKKGGASYSYVPAPLDYTGGNKMAELNLAQGRQFGDMTKTYHGGAVSLMGGPYPGALGDTLPQDLISSARLSPLEASFDEIKGMQDGGRRGKSRKSKSKKSKSRKSKSKKSKSRKSKSRKSKSRKSKSRKSKSRKSRKVRRGGGNHFASVDMPGMLLKDYSKTGLSPEWNLAKNPNAFAPLASRS